MTESSPLPGRIHSVALEGIPQAPTVVVDEHDSTRTVAERLRAPRSNSPFAILVRVATLNSPDVVEPISAIAHDGTIDVDVELRRYQGPLFANLQFVAVLEIGPVSLGIGQHQLNLTIHERSFDVIDEPGRAGEPVISTRTATFSVPG